jgi:hypothetical protein
MDGRRSDEQPASQQQPVNDGIDHLASVIAAHLREWEPAPVYVELAVFGTDDAPAIAAALDAFCRQHLGASVARGLFHRSSIGSVTAVALRDGRAVVIKAHQPERSRDLLAEIVRVQTYLADRGVLATRVLAGPLPIARGFAIVEAFDDAGAKADPHRRQIRAALAAGLHAIARTCAPLVATTSLPPSLLASAGDALWPTPHSKLFDFAATARGAEWIDAIAQRARARMRPAGRRVIGHSDWRREHVLFRDDVPVLAYDWDSLACDREPALVGIAAHAFCADWTETRRQVPTREEAHAFIADYARARGRPFDGDERRLAGASLVYATAYTARCTHAGGGDHRETPGSFQHLLWHEGERLLEVPFTLP